MGLLEEVAVRLFESEPVVLAVRLSERVVEDEGVVLVDGESLDVLVLDVVGLSELVPVGDRVSETVLVDDPVGEFDEDVVVLRD